MLLFVVGKTSCGKDTIARYIRDNYDFGIVCSYVDRPMRKGEVNGREHWFVSKEEMDELFDREDVIGRVKFDYGIRACALGSELKDSDMIYIIDPAGIDWYKKESKLQVPFHALYVYLPEDIIYERAKLRGDNLDAVTKRLDGERNLFDTYYNNHEWDYCINTEQGLIDTYEQVNNFMESMGYKRKGA